MTRLDTEWSKEHWNFNRILLARSTDYNVLGRLNSGIMQYVLYILTLQAQIKVPHLSCLCCTDVLESQVSVHGQPFRVTNHFETSALHDPIMTLNITWTNVPHIYMIYDKCYRVPNSSLSHSLANHFQVASHSNNCTEWPPGHIYNIQYILLFIDLSSAIIHRFRSIHLNRLNR